MHYENELGGRTTVIPDTELERRVLSDLLTRLVADYESRAGVYPPRAPGASFTGDRWPLNLCLKDLEHAESGWWRGLAHTVQPTPENTSVVEWAMEHNQHADFEVALGYWPGAQGTPMLLWRRDAQSEASTQPFFLDAADPGWR